MNFLSLKSFANTLVSLALLAALAGGLSWVFSTHLLLSAKPASVAPSSVASPAAVSTQAPATAPVSVLQPEVNNQAQIIAVLSTLAEKDATAYQQGNFWAYQVTENLSGSGVEFPTGPIYEKWLHFKAGKCLEMLATSREGAKSSRFKTLQVGLQDGTYGDLVALRQGQAKSLKTLRTDWQCAVLANDTDAGRLADRLKSGEAKLKLQQVHAWYETLQATPLLIVEATFIGVGTSPEVQRETHRFNMTSGRMLEADISIDGRPAGGVAQSKSIQFLPELPEGVLRLFEQSAQELLFYRDQPLSTATPVSIFK